MCFEKMLKGISETVHERPFKHLPLCLAPLYIVPVGITGALKTKEN